MKARLVVFLFLLASLNAFPQDDPVKNLVITGAKKVTAAIGFNQYVAYCTKGKWGLYDKDQQKILVKPAFQRIVFMPADTRAGYQGFFGIIKNKIGFYRYDGAEIIAPAYTQLGMVQNRYYEYVNDVYSHFLCDNMLKELVFAEDGSGIRPGKSVPGDVFSVYDRQFILRLEKNLLYINHYGGEPRPVPYLTRYDGLDSVDVNGNTVYEPVVYDEHSGVIDIKTGTWKIEPKYSHAFTSGMRTIAINHAMEKDTLREKIEVYNTVFEKVHSNADIKKLLSNPQEVKWVLPYENIEQTQLLPTGFGTIGNCIFWVKGKAGVFSFGNFSTVLPPEYDLILDDVPFADFVTVKNGFVGSKTQDGSYLFKLENKYKSIECIETNYTATYIRLDNKWYNYRIGDSLILEACQKPTDARVTRRSSATVQNDRVIVENWMAQGPEVTEPLIEGIADDGVTFIYKIQTDPEGNPVFDANGNPIYDYPPPLPGFSKSGVYDLAAKKWIIPAQYEKVIACAHGYAAKGQNKEKRNDSDHEIALSFFSLTGEPVFSNVPLDETAASEQYMKQLTGLNITNVRSFIEPQNIYRWNTPVILNTEYGYGLFDAMNAHWIVPAQYDFIDYSTMWGNFILVKNGKMGMIEETGKTIIPVEYTSMEAINNYSPFKIKTNTNEVYSLTGGLLCESEALCFTEDRYNNNRDAFNVFIQDNRIFFNEWRYEYYNIEEGYYGEMASSEVNDTWTRIYDLNTKTFTRFDSIRTVTPVSDVYILESKRGSKFIAGKDFKLISPTAYINWQKAGNDIYLSRSQNRYYTNGDGSIVSSDYASTYYYDGFWPYGNYFDVVRNGKLVSIPENYWMDFVFPSGKAVVHEFGTDPLDGSVNALYYLLDSKSGKIVSDTLFRNVGTLAVYPLQENNFAISIDYSYGISKTFILRESGTLFDTLFNTDGRITKADPKGKNFWFSNGTTFQCNYTGKITDTLSAEETASMEYINPVRSITMKKTVSLVDQDLNVIADSLENHRILKINLGLSSEQVAFLLATRQGNRFLFDMNGKVVLDLGKYTYDSSLRVLTSASPFTDSYILDKNEPEIIDFDNSQVHILKANKKEIPFVLNHGKFTALAQQGCSEYYKYSINDDAYIGFPVKDASFIVDRNGKTVMTFEKNTTLADLYACGMALVRNDKNGKYGFIDLQTQRYTNFTVSEKPRNLYNGYKGANDTLFTILALPVANKYNILRLTKTPVGDATLRAWINGVDAVNVSNISYLIITKNGKQFLYAMDGKKTEKGFDKIKGFLNGQRDVFLAFENNKTFILDPVYNNTYALESTAVDSIRFEESYASNPESIWLYNKNKKGWYYPKFGTLIPPVYDDIKPCYQDGGEKYFKINDNFYRKQSGEFLFPENGTAPITTLGRRYAFTQNTEGKILLLDTQTGSVIQINETPYRMITDGLLLVTKNNKSALYNVETNQLVCNYQFDAIEPLYEQNYGKFMYAYKNKGKWGLLDTGFKERTPAVYDSLVYFTCDSLNVIAIKQKNKWGVMTMEGKVLVKPVYSNVQSTEYIPYFTVVNEIPVKGKDPVLYYGLCDLNGKEVVPCVYDNIMSYTSDELLAYLYKGKKCYKLVPGKTPKTVEIKCD